MNKLLLCNSLLALGLIAPISASAVIGPKDWAPLECRSNYSILATDGSSRTAVTSARPIHKIEWEPNSLRDRIGAEGVLPLENGYEIRIEGTINDGSLASDTPSPADTKLLITAVFQKRNSDGTVQAISEILAKSDANDEQKYGSFRSAAFTNFRSPEVLSIQGNSTREGKRLTWGEALKSGLIPNGTLDLASFHCSTHKN